MYFYLILALSAIMVVADEVGGAANGLPMSIGETVNMSFGLCIVLWCIALAALQRMGSYDE